MGSRAALLPGRVLDVPGLVVKRRALSASGNSWCVCVLRTSCPWIAGTWLLLDPSCAVAWCCSTSELCVPAPPSSSLPAQRGWSGMPGQEGGTGQACYWQLCRALPELPVRGSGAHHELLVWPSWSSVAFSMYLPGWYFLKSHKFQHPLSNIDVSLYVSTCRGVSGQTL